MASGALEFFASLTTTKFKSGAKELSDVSRQASEGVAANFKKIAFAIAGIGAAFLGVRSAVQSFNSAVSYGGALNDLSARTGETAGNLAILQRAFENAGVGAESVGPVINKLQRAIVEAKEKGGESAKVFEKLKLNFVDLGRKTPTAQLRDVARAISRLPDAEKAAAAMQLLGRSGGELIPLFRALGSEFETAKEQLGSVPAIIDRTSKYLDAIGDNINAITHKGRDFMLGVLSKIAPALADITDKIAKIDAAKLGEIIGGYIKRFGELLAEIFNLTEGLDRIKLAIEQISKGNIGKGLELLFKTVRNLGLNAINEILAAAQAGIATVWQTLTSLFRANGPLVTMINMLFGFVSNKLKQSISESLAELPKSLGGGNERIKQAAIYGKTANDYLATASLVAPSLGRDVLDQAGRLQNRFADNFSNAARPFEMRGREAEVQNLADEALSSTLRKARYFVNQLQELMVNEPASDARRQKEAALIGSIQQFQTNEATTSAIKRMMAEAAYEYGKQNASSTNAQTDNSANEDSASETTLQKVASYLQELNNKLPAPVLV